jgi:hypothetical protein
MRKYLILFAAIAALFLTSCRSEDKIDPEFLATKNVSLTVNGTTKFYYSAAKCQLGYNASKKEFRVSNDDMSEYYIVTLESMPTEVNQKIKGNISWTESANIVTKNGIEFKVGSISDGQYWLWNSKEKIGVIVLLLK